MAQFLSDIWANLLEFESGFATLFVGVGYLLVYIVDLIVRMFARPQIN